MPRGGSWERAIRAAAAHCSCFRCPFQITREALELQGAQQLFTVFELLLQTGGCAGEEIKNTGSLESINDLESLFAVFEYAGIDHD